MQKNIFSCQKDSADGQDFYLMHKDIRCAVLHIDSNYILSVFPIKPEYMPCFGQGDILSNLRTWWQNRAAPGNREDMKAAFRDAGCLTGGFVTSATSSRYLMKNLGLSLTDTYWICPVGSDLRWRDVSLYPQGKSSAAVHDNPPFDPNASLTGQMCKHWDLSGDIPVLIKQTPLNIGQQAVNEAFASRLHSRQKSGIAYVSYTLRQVPYGEACRYDSICPAFTSEKTEFIPAHDIIASEKRPESRNIYDHFLDVCEHHGLNRNRMQRFLDYQTLTDFVISNGDEHLYNFGVLRDADTLQLLGPAPIFDSGNSMFYTSHDVSVPMTRGELLRRKVNAAYDSEEKLLRLVKNRDVVDVRKLPSENEVKVFYSEHGISESRVKFIAANYRIKCELLEDFQHGKIF